MCFVLLHYHVLRYVCSAQYGGFLQFLNFLLFWYVAQVLSEWFWNGSSRHYYYWYHSCFHIHTCAEFLLEGLYILKYSQPLSWSHFCLQKLQHLSTCMLLFLLSWIKMPSLLLWIYYYYYYYYYYCHHYHHRRRHNHHDHHHQQPLLSVYFIKC